jgi:hypothetical protein
VDAALPVYIRPNNSPCSSVDMNRRRGLTSRQVIWTQTAGAGCAQVALALIDLISLSFSTALVE